MANTSSGARPPQAMLTRVEIEEYTDPITNEKTKMKKIIRYMPIDDDEDVIIEPQQFMQQPPLQQNMFYMQPYMQPYQPYPGMPQAGYMPQFGQAQMNSGQQFPNQNQAFFQGQQHFQYMQQQNMMQQQNPSGENPAYNFMQMNPMMQVNNRMGYPGPQGQLVNDQQQNMIQTPGQLEATTSTTQVRRRPGPKCKQKQIEAEQLQIPQFQQPFLQQPMMMPYNYPYGMYPMPPQQMQMGQSPSQQQQQPQMMLFYAPAPPLNQSDTVVIPSPEPAARIAPQSSPVMRITTPVLQALSNQPSPVISNTPSPIALINPVSSTTITSSQSPRRAPIAGVVAPKNMSNLRNISHSQGVQNKLADILAQRRLPTVDLTSLRQQEKPSPHPPPVKKPNPRNTKKTNGTPTLSTSAEPTKTTSPPKAKKARTVSSSSSASYESVSTESSVAAAQVGPAKSKVRSQPNSWKHLVRECSIKLGRLSRNDIGYIQESLKAKQQKRAHEKSMEDNFDRKPMEIDDLWNTNYIPISNEPTTNTGDDEDDMSYNSSNGNDFACDVKSEPDLELENYQFANTSIVTSAKKRSRKPLRQQSIESVAGSSRASPSKQTKNKSPVTPTTRKRRPETENVASLRNESDRNETAVHSIIERYKKQLKQKATASSNASAPTLIAKSELSPTSASQPTFKNLRSAVRNHEQLQSIIERRKQQQATQSSVATPTITASPTKTSRKEKEVGPPIGGGLVSGSIEPAKRSPAKQPTEKEEHCAAVRNHRQSLISSFLRKTQAVATPKAEIAEQPPIVVIAAPLEKESFESLRTAARHRQSKVSEILERRRHQQLRSAETATPATLVAKAEDELMASEKRVEQPEQERTDGERFEGFSCASLSSDQPSKLNDLILKTEGSRSEQHVQEQAKEDVSRSLQQLSSADTSKVSVPHSNIQQSDLSELLERQKPLLEVTEATATETIAKAEILSVPQPQGNGIEALRRASHSNIQRSSLSEILERRKQMLEVIETIGKTESVAPELLQPLENGFEAEIAEPKLPVPEPEKNGIEALRRASHSNIERSSISEILERRKRLLVVTETTATETIAKTEIVEPALPALQLQEDASNSNTHEITEAPDTPIARTETAQPELLPPEGESVEQSAQLIEEVDSPTPLPPITKVEETAQQSSVVTSTPPPEVNFETLRAASRQRQSLISSILERRKQRPAQVTTTTTVITAKTEPISEDETNLRLASHSNAPQSKLILERRRQQLQIETESTQLLVVAEHQPLRRLTIDSSQYASCDSLGSNSHSPDDIEPNDEGEASVNATVVDERTPTRAGPKSTKTAACPEFIEMENVPFKREVKKESSDDLVYIITEENALADIVSPDDDTTLLCGTESDHSTCSIPTINPVKPTPVSVVLDRLTVNDICRVMSENLRNINPPATAVSKDCAKKKPAAKLLNDDDSLSDQSFANAAAEPSDTDSESSEANEQENSEPGSLVKRLRSRTSRSSRRTETRPRSDSTDECCRTDAVKKKPATKPLNDDDSISDQSFTNAAAESSDTDSQSSETNKQENSEPSSLVKRLRSRNTSRSSKRKIIDGLPREPRDTYGTDSTDEYWDESQAKRFRTIRTRSFKKNDETISKHREEDAGHEEELHSELNHLREWRSSFLQQKNVAKTVGTVQLSEAGKNKKNTAAEAKDSDLEDELKKLQNYRTSFMKASNLQGPNSKPAAPKPLDNEDTSSDNCFGDNGDNGGDSDDSETPQEVQKTRLLSTNAVENNEKNKDKDLNDELNNLQSWRASFLKKKPLPSLDTTSEDRSSIARINNEDRSTEDEPAQTVPAPDCTVDNTTNKPPDDDLNEQLLSLQNCRTSFLKEKTLPSRASTSAEPPTSYEQRTEENGLVDQVGSTLATTDSAADKTNKKTVDEELADELQRLQSWRSSFLKGSAAATADSTEKSLVIVVLNEEKAKEKSDQNTDKNSNNDATARHDTVASFDTYTVEFPDGFVEDQFVTNSLENRSECTEEAPALVNQEQRAEESIEKTPVENVVEKTNPAKRASKSRAKNSQNNAADKAVPSTSADLGSALSSQNRREEFLHMNARIKCTLCFRQYARKNEKQHYKMWHSKANLPKCDMCNNYFLSTEAIWRHKYMAHGIIVSERKAFIKICTLCGKEFYDSTHLFQHMKVHSRIRKVPKCKFCQLEFEHPNDVVRHQVQVHNCPKFKCLTCDRLFIASCDLRMHSRSHSDEKPFICDLCPGRFKRRQDILQHMQKHMKALKNVRCLVCYKTFFSYDRYVYHMNLFHPTKPISPNDASL